MTENKLFTWTILSGLALDALVRNTPKKYGFREDALLKSLSVKTISREARPGIRGNGASLSSV